jgi:hypothetical protein
MAAREGLRTIAKMIRAVGAFSAAFFAWSAFDADANWKNFFLLTVGFLGVSWTIAWVLDKLAEK